MMNRTMLILIGAALTAISLYGCGATVPGIPVSGELAGQQIETTVDSEVARYYLESYLSGHRHDPSLDSLLDLIPADNPDQLPDRETLRAVAERFSVDLSALYLANAIWAVPENRCIAMRYLANLDELRLLKSAEEIPELYANPAVTVLFVPGWDYLDSGSQTGADFARPRQILTELGIDNLLVKIEPNGAVETNALILAEVLVDPAYEDRGIYLVSASSGGPVTAQALGGLLDPRQLRHVKAWLNIGGILHGSPVADHYLSWPQSWFARIVLLFKGWDVESIRSMSARESRGRFSSLTFPADLLILNYVGIPLSGDVSSRAAETYPILSKLGPNDGFTLIRDVLAPGSLTIFDMGADHFVGDDPEIDVKTVALARTLFGYQMPAVAQQEK